MNIIYTLCATRVCACVRAQGKRHRNQGDNEKMIEPIKTGEGYGQYRSYLVDMTAVFSGYADDKEKRWKESFHIHVIADDESKALTLARRYMDDNFANFELENICCRGTKDIVISDDIKSEEGKKLADALKQLDIAERTIQDLQDRCDIRGIIPLRRIEAMIEELKKIANEVETIDEDEIKKLAAIIDLRIQEANLYIGSMNKGMGHWIASSLVTKGYLPRSRVQRETVQDMTDYLLEKMTNSPLSDIDLVKIYASASGVNYKE